MVAFMQILSSRLPGGTTSGMTTPGTTVPPNQDQNTGNNSNNTDSTKPEPDNELTIKLLYYIVSFEPNGGTKLSRKTMTLLNDDNLGILPKVQRRNYSFSGWYTQKSGGQKVGESTVLNAGTTLYAHWAKIAKPAKSKVSALKSSKVGQIAVSLKKVTGIKGYEIYYSTNKKFTSSSTAKVTSMSTKKTLKI